MVIARRRQAWSSARGVVSCLVLSLGAVACVPPADSSIPSYRCDDCNVILIFVDSLRPDHLGCNGYTRGSTPRIDEFAAESVEFLRAYSPSNWTRSAVSAVLTSRYPVDVGILSEERSQFLRNAEWTLQEFFSGRGYDTASFATNVHYVFGLDQSFGHRYANIGEDAETLYPRVESWIDERRGGKFFVLIHHDDTHNPYRPRKGFGRAQGRPKDVLDLFPPGRDGYSRACESRRDVVVLNEEDLAQWKDAYDSEVSYLDHYFGEFLDHLRARGLYEKTVVIFTADHGEEFLEHGGYYHGCTLYDELLHVPLFVHFPGLPGRRVADRVGTIDLFPTLMDATGGADERSAGFRGRSLMPLAVGGSLPPVPLFHATGFKANPRFALIDGPFKLIAVEDGTVLGLYDLDRDPGETANLAMERRDVAERLRGRLLEILSSAAPLSSPEPDPEVTDEIRKRMRSLGYLD